MWRCSGQLEQLKSEQDNQLQQLLRELKKQERQLEQKELAHMRQGEQAKDTVLTNKAVMDGVQRKLSEVEAQVARLQAEVQRLVEYRHEGLHEHRTQITQLEEELECMQADADAATEHRKSQLELTLSMIDTGTTQAIEGDRLAQEMKVKALDMDKASQEARAQNQWLKETVALL
ncbi:hypothetical protein NHX12_010438 [Muraenolepis orangiensis]|uniref:Uncharacterized protein n=1 Tax=Muraenolepis orangiensis TaxID=630683 RepID=A0A9Q0DLB1_9TELE|nr:hypothetical protein NHX12_010438 [Muraenolepis orangiensis]